MYLFFPKDVPSKPKVLDPRRIAEAKNSVQVLVPPQRIVSFQNGMSGVNAALLVVSQHV